MSSLMQLVWRSLSYYWSRNLLLMLAIALTVFVPSAVITVAKQAMESLSERANQTPLVLGPSGSETDLVLQALYFKGAGASTITMASLNEIPSKRATAIPLHLRFFVNESPVVCTTEKYFAYRDLRLEKGGSWERFGDCILGARAFQLLQARLGASIITNPKTMFNVAADFPVKMRVVGVLAPTGTADDDAVFASMQTGWIIEGIGHGHTPSNDADETASAARAYTEITAENAGRFHFHGNPNDFPCSAAIVLPVNNRAETLLIGEYANRTDSQLQLAEPSRVMQRLFASVVRVRWAMMLGAIMMIAATAILLVIVLWLTFKLRHNEFVTLTKLGASKGQVAFLMLTECLVVILAGLLCSIALTATLTINYRHAIRWFLT